MQDIENHIVQNVTQDNSLPCGTETILLVDDEIECVDIASFHLTSLGYNIIKAYSSKEAFKMIQANQRFDLIISDIVMPGKINGFLLAQEAFNQNSNIKILLASGYIKMNDTIPNNPLIANLLKSLLKKPYNKRTLATAVRRTLDA